jgi:NADP-dependent 3-hydroxy acid dehydrogenase YdfG
MSNITGKIVVITGASSGLGESTARLLAVSGAKVVLERGAKIALTRSSGTRLGNQCATIRHVG